jgi:hypothetical protein
LTLALSETDPASMVTVGLIGGTLTAGTHFAKAGNRLAINTSPEPFSNWVASFGEEGIVLAGLWAMLESPLVFLVLLAVFMVYRAGNSPVFPSAGRDFPQGNRMNVVRKFGPAPFLESHASAAIHWVARRSFSAMSREMFSSRTILSIAASRARRSMSSASSTRQLTSQSATTVALLVVCPSRTISPKLMPGPSEVMRWWAPSFSGTRTLTCPISIKKTRPSHACPVVSIDSSWR